jgi:hypothetical protein
MRLIVQPYDEDGYYFFPFPSNGAPVEWNWQGKTEESGENPVPVPLCLPQIPHGPIRASAVEGRRLTAWAMARPIKGFANHYTEFVACVCACGHAKYATVRFWQLVSYL